MYYGCLYSSSNYIPSVSWITVKTLMIVIIPSFLLPLNVISLSEFEMRTVCSSSYPCMDFSSQYHGFKCSCLGQYGLLCPNHFTFGSRSIFFSHTTWACSSVFHPCVPYLSKMDEDYNLLRCGVVSHISSLNLILLCPGVSFAYFQRMLLLLPCTSLHLLNVG